MPGQIRADNIPAARKIFHLFRLREHSVLPCSLRQRRGIRRNRSGESSCSSSVILLRSASKIICIFLFSRLKKVFCSSKLTAVMCADVTSRLHVRELALVCIILFLTAFFTIMCLFPVDIVTASGFTPCDFPLALTVGRSGPMPADQPEVFLPVVVKQNAIEDTRSHLKEFLHRHGISHATLEFESASYPCPEA